MVSERKDLVYANRSSRNVLDIAVPDGTANPPLVVFIHGGAFRMGDKRDSARERGALLDAGYAVASVNYRFSTEAIWPAQLDDLRDAFAFLRRSAADLGVDGQRIASFGSSAGGHLSASCGIAFSADPETRLAASIVWYPPVDFPEMDADMIASGVPRATGRNDEADSPESTLCGATVAENPERARSAGPIAQLATLRNGTPLPPFLIMHGALDPFIATEQSRRLHRALAAFGTSPRLELDILPLGTHGGGEFAEPAAMDRVVAFLADSFEQRGAASASLGARARRGT